MINEIRFQKFKRVTQTLIYLPYFISWVVIGGILVNLLSPSWGIVNDVIKTMGGEPVFFLGSDKYFRAIAVVSHIWKQAGWDTIIYLAAITAVNPDLYEAEKIDGAGNFQRIWHVTIPCIKPTIVILLLISIGNILNNGFEQIYVLQNGSNLAVSEVFETYTYKSPRKQRGFLRVTEFIAEILNEYKNLPPSLPFTPADGKMKQNTLTG